MRLTPPVDGTTSALDGRVVGGRYELLELLGEGGAARVFRAHDRVLDRIVAVKLLRAEYGTDPDFVARFQREARAVASLSHPNIVEVYDYGSFADTYFIAMQYIEGTDLKAVLRHVGRLAPNRAVAIVSGVLRGLGAAHEHGLIHRDVKPQNVLVRAGDGLVKLTDFGVARAIGAAQRTAAGTTFGTVHYMAPEQATSGEVGPTADLYAAAVVLFEALAGRLPFEGETTLAITAQHLHAPVPSLSAVAPQVPPALARVVERALAKDPAARYQHAEAMRRAIAAAVGDSSAGTIGRSSPTCAASKASTARLTTVLPTPAIAPMASTPAISGPSRVAHGGYGCLLPALCALIVVLSIGLFALVRGGLGSSPPPTVRVIGGMPGGSGGVLAQGQSPNTPTQTAISAPTLTSPPTAITPATATTVPTQLPVVVPEPTFTLAPLTATMVPPTSTALPPTPTVVPPTATVPPPTPVPTRPPPPAVATNPPLTATAQPRGATFTPYQLQGAYRRDDGVLYGLPAVALYGQGSGYNEGTLMFQVAQLPDGAIQLVLTGLDDERAEHCRLQVIINGVAIFDDLNAFPNVPDGDNGVGGQSRYWQQMVVAVPEGVLREGRNTLTLRNRTPGAKPGIPYILIHDLGFVGE